MVIKNYGKHVPVLLQVTFKILGLDYQCASSAPLHVTRVICVIKKDSTLCIQI